MSHLTAKQTRNITVEKPVPGSEIKLQTSLCTHSSFRFTIFQHLSQLTTCPQHQCSGDELVAGCFCLVLLISCFKTAKQSPWTIKLIVSSNEFASLAVGIGAVLLQRLLGRIAGDCPFANEGSTCGCMRNGSSRMVSNRIYLK